MVTISALNFLFLGSRITHHGYAHAIFREDLHVGCNVPSMVSECGIGYDSAYP
jgi:hypothetical protein